MEDLQKIAELEDQSCGLSIFDVFLDKTFLKPLALCCILFTVQAMSGTVLLSFYSAVIFKDIGISTQYVPMIYLVSMHVNKLKWQVNVFISVTGNPGIQSLSKPAS